MNTLKFFENNEILKLAMKEDFPVTYKLLQYNPKGTIHYLKHREILSAYAEQFVTGLEYDGDDNLKTWSEYKKAVDLHVEKLNSDERLDKARKLVADKIKTEHYNKYPCWPKVNETQAAVVDITNYGGYQRDKVYVAFACEGNISVTDSVKEIETKSNIFYSFIKWIVNGGNNKIKHYYTKFSGKPLMKIVYIELLALKAFERQALKNFEKAKTKVDNKAIQVVTERIKFWDGFKFSDDEKE